MDDRIAEACGLPTARFAFNSSAVIIGDASALNTLATCFATGALKGKAMRLVGHADPRGETAYNFGLGQERAGSVAEYLKARGVGQTQLNTGSKGELEATGVDEDGWRRDRRVDILLVE